MALSQHLARLRRKEFVRTRREAQTVCYALAGDHARAVIEALHRLDEEDGGKANGRGSLAPRGVV